MRFYLAIKLIFRNSILSHIKEFITWNKSLTKRYFQETKLPLFKKGFYIFRYTDFIWLKVYYSQFK